MMTADWFLLERDMIPGALACAVRGKFEKSSISAGYVGIMPEVICYESSESGNNWKMLHNALAHSARVRYYCYYIKFARNAQWYV